MTNAVVILNWNGKSWLEKFLPNVVQYSSEAEIWVIDNDSTDGSVEYLRNHFPKVQQVCNDSNLGFAGGYNEGLKSITADNYILLNSDIEVTEGWLTPALEVLNSADDIVCVQPKILAFDRKDYFEHAGAGGGMMDKWCYPLCRGRIFDLTEKDENQYEASEIFWASGACLFIKAKAFHNQGGFDADFFAHMEEIDLCWRLKNEGKRVIYCPDSVVYHVGGGTLNYQSPRKTFLNFRNSLFAIHKNYGGFTFGIIMLRLWLDGIAGFKFLLGGKLTHIWAIIKAHFSYYAHLGRMQKKRKKLKQVKYSQLTGSLRKSIVVEYYLKGGKKYSQL